MAFDLGVIFAANIAVHPSLSAGSVKDLVSHPRTERGSIHLHLFQDTLRLCLLGKDCTTVLNMLSRRECLYKQRGVELMAERRCWGAYLLLIAQL